MSRDALFDWLRRASRADVRDARDLYDGRALLDALDAATGATTPTRARRGEDAIQTLSRQLRRAGMCDDVDALRARDARGTTRVVREIYAESLRRRVAAFAVDAVRDGRARFADATPSPTRRRDDDDDDDDDDPCGRDLCDAFEDEDGDEDDDVERDAWALDADVDELDSAEDWRAAANAATKAPRARGDGGFVKASDMLRELHLNARAGDDGDDVERGTRASPRETKTLTRTPPAVPKALRLIPKAKPVKWDVVFDDPKPSRRAPTWFPGRDAPTRASKSSREPSPPATPVAVSWFGERGEDDDGDGTASLQRAARRRGRLTSSLSPATRRGASSPERRRSDVGVAACYVPALARSNKRVIRNALRVLVGPPDRESYAAAVRAIDECEFPSVVLLLKGSADVAPRKLRGVYAVVDEDTLKRVHGAGPEYVHGNAVLASLKFDTATMSFEPLASRAITPTVAAISLTRAR